MRSILAVKTRSAAARWRRLGRYRRLIHQFFHNTVSEKNFGYPSILHASRTRSVWYLGWFVRQIDDRRRDAPLHEEHIDQKLRLRNACSLRESLPHLLDVASTNTMSDR